MNKKMTEETKQEGVRKVKCDDDIDFGEEEKSQYPVCKFRHKSCVNIVRKKILSSKV